MRTTTQQVVFLAAMMALTILPGCSQQGNPVSDVSHQGGNGSSSWYTGENPFDNGFPDFIKQPKGNKTITSASGQITVPLGGKVDLKTKFYDPIGKKTVEISMNLKVPANAVTEPVTITMVLDTTNLLTNITLQPHGTVFSKPALLNVTCTGLDLNGLSTGDVELFYVVNGQYVERNVARSIKITPSKGELVAKDVEMNHFSQYAFGRKRGQ